MNPCRYRVSLRTDPLGRTDQCTTYGGMGNVLTALDHQGQTRTFTWDDFGEPMTASYADGSTTRFSWNVMGTEWKVVDSVGGTIERSYDGLNGLYGEQTAQGTINWNNFDALNRARNEYVTGVNGVSQLYQYAWDNANRLVEIKGPSGTVKFSDDAANRRTVAQLPNGISGGAITMTRPTSW